MAATTVVSSYREDRASWGSSAALATPAFPQAGKLISVFEQVRAQALQETEVVPLLKSRVQEIGTILNHPQAPVILTLAITHLIKTNQWQMLQQVRLFFENDLSKTFRTTGWTQVTFNEPLETWEIENVRKALFKAKGAQLEVAHTIDPIVLQLAWEKENGGMLGVIGSYRTPSLFDPDFLNPDFSYHKTPILMQRFKDETQDELRIYIADSCVDKVIRINGELVLDSLQDDIIDQVKRHASAEHNIVFYRFPSSLEDTPAMDKEGFYYFGKYRRQARGFDCSLFAIRDLYALYQLANEGKLWEDARSSSSDPNTKVVWTIPGRLMYSTQGLTIIQNHPNGSTLLETLRAKNCIAPNPYANNREVNRYLDRFRALYHHYTMIPADVLNPNFLKSWASYRDEKILPLLTTTSSASPLAPLEPQDIYAMTCARIKAAPSFLVQQIYPLYSLLPMPIQEIINGSIWDLHTVKEEGNPNWGAYHLLDDLQIFYRSMDIVFKPTPTSIESFRTMQYTQTFLNAIDDFLNQLPKPLSDKIYIKIWNLRGSPIDGDLNWGRTHRFEDMEILYLALQEAFLVPSLASPPAEECGVPDGLREAAKILLQSLPLDLRAAVFTRIWELDGSPDGFNYGSFHALDSTPRLLNVIAEALTPLPCKDTSSEDTSSDSELLSNPESLD